MITKHFSFHLPESAAAAVAVLGESPEPTEVLGGGTWVVPEMTNGKRRPTRVVDLRRAGLGEIATDGDRISLGATVTYRDLLRSPLVAERLPLLQTLALGITGGSQIWNQGTIGGSACYANPASDVPAALVALDATLRLHGTGGVREVAAGDFFLGPFEADVRPGEILAEILVHPYVVTGYVKFKLSESSWPIVTAAYAETDAGAHVVVGGAEAVPHRFAVTSRAEIAAQVTDGITDPWTDVLASGEYRRSIAGVIAERAIDQALHQEAAA